MIVVTAKNANAAWKSTISSLYADGVETGNDKYFRDEPVVIELMEPSLEPVDPLFPMSQEDISVINEFIISGLNEDKVVHEWTKLYYHRIFDQPYSQMDYFIKKLREDLRGETVISMWKKEIDQDMRVSPCTQYLWGRVKNNALELHVHAHSSDAYKKLLMNMQEFISLQQYVAKQLGVRVGKYFHYLDSCHLYHSDLAEVEKVYRTV